jgi:hypothetical protein
MMLRNSSRSWWLVWMAMAVIVFCVGTWESWFYGRKYAATASFRLGEELHSYLLAFATVQDIADVQAQKQGTIAKVEPFVISEQQNRQNHPGHGVFAGPPKEFNLTAYGKTPALATAAANSVLQEVYFMSYLHVSDRISKESAMLGKRSPHDRLLDPSWDGTDAWNLFEITGRASTDRAYRSAGSWGTFTPLDFGSIILMATLTAALSHQIASRKLALHPR